MPSSRRPSKPSAAAIAIGAAALIAAAALWLYREALVPPALEPPPRIPALFAPDLPPDCRQVVLVLSPSTGSISARLWLMERAAPDAVWRPVKGPMAATVGRNGLAWGLGEHRSIPPAGFPIKIEGDKCSPAGVFKIPFAFGLAPEADATWLKVRYLPLTPTIIGVDDPKSRYYNQIVDNTVVERDWDSNEAMIRRDKLYEWGAFIAHNPGAVPGAGSCIFFHLWPGEGKPTAGCTAMSAEDLRAVIGWLDAGKQPRLVQGVEGW